MRYPITVLTAVLLLSISTRADSSTKRLLYMSTPDAAQEGDFGKGILVFDIDNDHRFVRRIEIPFKEGLRGFCGNVRRHAVYYTTTNRRLGAFDLESEKILWERTYDLGCDRACITPDGTKLYVPTGWWWKGTNSGLMIVNPDNGDLIKRLPAGTSAHNSIASLDGRFAYLGTDTNLWMFSAADGSLVRDINNVGESGVFPFTIDSRNRYAYVCLGKHVGFDVVNLQTGEVPHRVLAGSEPIPHRTHGAALTPDEKELWISDQEGKGLFIFDATLMPPKESGHVDLTRGGHGWVTFSLDGHYVWCHTPDIIDARSRKIVATFKDENGKAVCGSKFIEVHLQDGKVVEMGDQFGLGRAQLKVSAR